VKYKIKVVLFQLIRLRLYRHPLLSCFLFHLLLPFLCILYFLNTSHPSCHFFLSLSEANGSFRGKKKKLNHRFTSAVLVISSKQERRPIDPESVCCECSMKMPLPVYWQICGSWARVILFKTETVSVHNHICMHTVVTYIYTQAGTHEYLSIRGPYIPDIYRNVDDKVKAFHYLGTEWEKPHKT
jgi:hypothetical protein